MKETLLMWVKVPLGVHIMNVVNTAGGIFSSVREFSKNVEHCSKFSKVWKVEGYHACL